MRIGAFEGKDAKNNRLILEVLALNEPLIKWGVLKEVKKQTDISWPTVSRRIDDLKNRGYIEVTGKKKTNVGKRALFTPEYWLTLKGLITALTIAKVRREKPSRVLQKLVPIWAIMVKELEEEEINSLVQVLVDKINALPFDLESASKLEIRTEISPILISAMSKLPESYWRKLERNPDFLKFQYNGYARMIEVEKKILKVYEARKQRYANLMKNSPKKRKD